MHDTAEKSSMVRQLLVPFSNTTVDECRQLLFLTLMRRPLLLLLYVISRYAGASLLRRETSLDLSQWSLGNEADANQLLQVSIALTIQNADLGVETLLRISDPTSRDHGQCLSAGEVAGMIQHKPNAVSDVIKWLEESGINQSNVNLSYGGDRLSLKLSVREDTLLLETTLDHQSHQETG